MGGDSFLNVLKETAEHAKAIVAWGSCASNGCVQAACPNPTGAKPVSQILPGRKVINVPGCLPIAEVMTGILTYLLTFDAIPELDEIGRRGYAYAVPRFDWKTVALQQIEAYRRVIDRTASPTLKRPPPDQVSKDKQR